MTAPAQSHLTLPIRAATEIAAMHGIVADRCDILQDGHTLVLRLAETLVARVVTDREGPRQGGEWFARENAIALHLTQSGAPVIPLHPDLPPGPHEHLGFTLNFWLFVHALDQSADLVDGARKLRQCHEVLVSFQQSLPQLAIIHESLALLESLTQRSLLSSSSIDLLRRHLLNSLDVLRHFPHQPLHGDAHAGNLMLTTRGLLWTDWEDGFSGPVEWDVASLIWNTQILDRDTVAADRIITAYRDAGGTIDMEALHHSLIARAAVMSAWYPILYPNPNADRQAKLQRRLDWLSEVSA